MHFGPPLESDKYNIKIFISYSDSASKLTWRPRWPVSLTRFTKVKEPVFLSYCLIALKTILTMAKEKIPCPMKVGHAVIILATNIHSGLECNCHLGGLVKTERVDGIVRHIENV
jgi:hypothetical protein